MSASLRLVGSGRLCNEALDEPLTDEERVEMIKAAAGKLEELLAILRVDFRRDHNARETPTRVARMLVEETMAGRFTAPPPITAFENARGFDDLIFTGPIELRSTCAHHLMPIYGQAFVGIVPDPGGKIIGLSKYDRIVAHFAARLQIQEELTRQIGSHIMEVTAPRGVAVRISAVHMCKTHRGVCASHQSRMVTNSYSGAFSKSPARREQFSRECASLARGS